MDEQWLLKAALVGGSLGLAILFALVYLQPPANAPFMSSKDGDTIVIEGPVARAGGAGVIVRHTEDVDVAIFSNHSLKRGDLVRISGRIEDYKGKRQVVADRIVKQG